MTPNHLAIMLYGALTYVMLATLAITVGNVPALAMVVVASFFTYTFQVLQETGNDGDNVWAYVSWAAAVLFAFTSFVLSLWSFQ